MMFYLFQAGPVVETNIEKYLEGHSWLGIRSFQDIIPSVLGAVLTIAVVIFILFLLIGGIQWITAGGDKEALSNARARLTTAIVGILIVFSAWAILGLLKNFFGLTATGERPRPPIPPTPAGATSLAECRNTICPATQCHGFDSFCYQNCRCVCDRDGNMWAYENPWCDTDTHQYACLGGVRTLDRNGTNSQGILAESRDMNCSGD